MEKRVFSFLLCCLLIVSYFTTPSKAWDLDVGIDIDAVEFFDWCISQGYSTTVNPFLSWFDKSVCPSCPDVTARHIFVEQRTTVDGKTGLYYVCEYCGKSAGEVGEEAYQQQVSALPATGYTSAGKLIWQPKFSDFEPSSIFNGTRFSGIPVSASHVKYSVLPSGNGICCEVLKEQTNWNFSFNCAFISPILGTYQPVESLWLSCSLVGDMYYSPSDISMRYNGDESVGFFYSPSFRHNFGPAVFYAYFPVFEITPGIAIAGDSYNINTRPTSITGGNYGIVGDDGTINTVTNNNKIVNETTNNYYNPATGETKPILDWSYNYEDRTYDLTLDTGDKVSVEYGDQNITITENTVVEGDTIVNNYTIYYIIEGSGDNPTPGPTSCPHDWQEGSSTAPTCTAPGKTVYTCSQCGQTKTEIVPALGHDWKVLRTVLTEYDEDGNQTQEGYTIYECTRCGEQYKDMASTGPPDDSVNDGGLLELLNGIIKYLSDNLSGAVELILSFFREIPALFNGFTAFLAAVFPYLPEEIMLLLTFGIAALVIVGFIKAIRR